MKMFIAFSLFISSLSSFAHASTDCQSEVLKKTQEQFEADLYVESVRILDSKSLKNQTLFQVEILSSTNSGETKIKDLAHVNTDENCQILEMRFLWEQEKFEEKPAQEIE